MNIICAIFGHKAPAYAVGKGWGGWDYADLILTATDGLGRQHANVYGDCARCEKRFRVCAVHIPEVNHDR